MTCWLVLDTARGFFLLIGEVMCCLTPCLCVFTLDNSHLTACMHVYLGLSGVDHPAGAVSGHCDSAARQEGCLKVEDGLEHFKAMLTSKLADAKSALCKWTASTPKNLSPKAEDNSTVLSIHWYYLKLEHFYRTREKTCEYMQSHFNFKWTNRRKILSNYITHTKVSADLF